MKIELDLEAEEILNNMTMDGLIQALREKFKMQEREIERYKARCDVAGEWFDDLLEDVEHGTADHTNFVKYADWDFDD